MSRTTKVLGFSVPPSMLEEVEQMAREEHRTKSELFREMLRVYRVYRKRYPEPYIDPARVMHNTQKEEQGSPPHPEELSPNRAAGRYPVSVK